MTMVLASAEIGAGMGVPVGTPFPDAATVLEISPPELLVLSSEPQRSIEEVSMADFADVFAGLRAIMEPFARSLEREVDRDDELSLDTRHVQSNGTPLWFGDVQVKKRYVSYHLMPVYANAALLDDVSPALRKRVQGKSCFNFTKADPALFEELAALTQAGFDDYRTKGYV